MLGNERARIEWLSVDHDVKSHYRIFGLFGRNRICQVHRFFSNNYHSRCAYRYTPHDCSRCFWDPCWKNQRWILKRAGQIRHWTGGSEIQRLTLSDGYSFSHLGYRGWFQASESDCFRRLGRFGLCWINSFKAAFDRTPIYFSKENNSRLLLRVEEHMYIVLTI